MIADYSKVLVKQGTCKKEITVKEFYDCPEEYIIDGNKKIFIKSIKKRFVRNRYRTVDSRWRSVVTGGNTRIITAQGLFLPEDYCKKRKQRVIYTKKIVHEVSPNLKPYIVLVELFGSGYVYEFEYDNDYMVVEGFKVFNEKKGKK